MAVFKGFDKRVQIWEDSRMETTFTRPAPADLIAMRRSPGARVVTYDGRTGIILGTCGLRDLIIRTDDGARRCYDIANVNFAGRIRD